jgi:hypothetical protein
MAATASIEIVVDDQGATQAFRNINAEAAKLGPTMQPVAKISEQTFNNIEGGALKSREAAALFGEELGVKVPRAIRGVIAESALLGPAFAAAFSGLAIVAFIELAKQAIEQLTGFGAAFTAIEKGNAAMLQSVASANKILIGPQNLEQITARLGSAQKAVNDLNNALGLTGDIVGDSLKSGLASKFSVSGGIMVAELEKQKGIVDELYVEQAKLLDEQRRTEPIEVLRLTNDARIAGLEGMAKINAGEKEQTAVVRAEMAAQITTHRVGMAEINKIHAEAAAARAKMERDAGIAGTQAVLDATAAGSKGELQIHEEYEAALHRIDQQELQEGIQLVQQKEAIQITSDNRMKQLRQQNAEDVKRAEEQAAVDILPPWQQAYAQISLDTQRRLREIQQALKDTRITAEDAAKLSAAAWQEEFAKTRDKLASDLESAFDEITSGGIGKYFLTQFKHLVFQMVATWILGMNQMHAASQGAMGSGGGILGSIFGGIFGGGGGGGSQGGISSLPGVITNFGGGSGDFGGETSGGSGDFGGETVGLSAGMGSGTPGIVLPSGASKAGSAIGGISGQLGSLLAKVFPNGLKIGGATISGAALATIGIGLVADSFGKGGILRGLEGAGGGALTGFAIAGPIGAAVGALVGFFAGFLQHSTKKARLAIEANIKTQSQAIEDAYNSFQVDSPTSHDELEQLRTQGVDALKQAGVKDISRSRVGHVDHWIDKAETEIAATQAERDRRSAIAFGPAEFHTGGFVGWGMSALSPGVGGARAFHSGGVVNANLLEGEFVMGPQAVARYGLGTLSRMNSGGGAGDTHIYISAIDAKSFDQFLDRGGGKKIVQHIRREQRAGWY